MFSSTISNLLWVLMLFELHSLCQRSLDSLIVEAKGLGINRPNLLSRDQLLLDFLFHSVSTSTDAGQKPKVVVSGYLEILQGGFGFLRSAHFGFQPSAIDIYVSPTQILRFALCSGDWIEGLARLPRASENNLALLQIRSVNSDHPNRCEERIPYANRFLTQSDSVCFANTTLLSVDGIEDVQSMVHHSQDRGFTTVVYMPFITDLMLQDCLFQFSKELNNGQFFFSKILDAQQTLYETHRLFVNRMKVLASSGQDVHCILLSLENLRFGCSLYIDTEPTFIQMLTELAASSCLMANVGSISTSLLHYTDLDADTRTRVDSLEQLGLLSQVSLETLEDDLVLPT